MRACLLLAAVLVVLCGCGTNRIEHYDLPDASPQLRGSDLLQVQVLYHKQTQRTLSALVRITNHLTVPLVFDRRKADATHFTLGVLGHTYEALPPRNVTWHPYAATTRRASQDLVEIAPGAAADLDLQWEYPDTVGDFEYPWTLTISNWRIDVVVGPALTVAWPPPEAKP